jgi:hypothetical protein
MKIGSQPGLVWMFVGQCDALFKVTERGHACARDYVVEGKTYRLNDLDDKVAPSCSLGAFGGGCDEDVLRDGRGRKSEQGWKLHCVVVCEWSCDEQARERCKFYNNINGEIL